MTELEMTEEHQEILQDVIDGIDPNVLWDFAATDQQGQPGWMLKLRKDDQEGELWVSRQEVESAELANREGRLTFERKIQAAVDSIGY